MNVVKYLLSRKYRDRYDEEYTKEIIDKINLERKEYEQIYKEIRAENGANNQEL